MVLNITVAAWSSFLAAKKAKHSRLILSFPCSGVHTHTPEDVMEALKYAWDEVVPSKGNLLVVVRCKSVHPQMSILAKRRGGGVVEVASNGVANLVCR